uniref:Uncharacterized protein n=1 Tax=Ananas comosus var. bracteatus TaxID=296719 RepID=A0A6V7PMJ0_ANACO|nr:unnamed protein product [Ananas comosus var. bracteatus]
MELVGEDAAAAAVAASPRAAARARPSSPAPATSSSPALLDAAPTASTASGASPPSTGTSPAPAPRRRRGSSPPGDPRPRQQWPLLWPRRRRPRLPRQLPGPATSPFTLRLAARVTESSLITVSLGRVPRLGFAPAGQSLLSEIPSVGFAAAAAVAAPEEEEEEEGAAAVAAEEGSVVIAEHVLENLLTLNHSEEADNPVPRTVANLVVHVVDTHVDQVQDIVTKLEMDLDAIEIELDKGGSLIKKQMLDDRRFPKMHLNLQRLLQVVSHGEQVFPRVKEKCVSKSWFTNEDVVAFEELIGRLRRLKESLGFITNRVIAVQAGLDSWQSEQINRNFIIFPSFP